MLFNILLMSYDVRVVTFIRSRSVVLSVLRASTSQIPRLRPWTIGNHGIGFNVDPLIACGGGGPGKLGHAVSSLVGLFTWRT